MFSESANGQQHLDNPTYAQYYNDKIFTILSFGRFFFHLSTLEAVYIQLSKPNLYCQKKLVHNMKSCADYAF